MREHIREQIEYRINSMNRECFENGSCIKCGCQTTHLQMANKACKGDCYPSMVDKGSWEACIIIKHYEEGYYDDKNNYPYTRFELDTRQEKFIKQ